ncbi:MAG: T9SS type A sorting domain-containing protein, partial [Candidatus Aegiribacteria sp.]|nr:T9SS type A sorting domain-containing protein [Candidatus Aegiribacteria sp.]
SYVVHYIFEGELPREYVGNIQVYFGNPGQLVGGGPRDLAGNTLDSYPGTVAEARTDYGPFSYNGFEAGPDTNYFMYDPPDWYPDFSTNIVYGTVGIEHDTVATVDLNSIGLEDAMFIGDCDYWCGFWMYREIPGEYGFNIYVVKPDGSYIDHSFKTPFPVFDGVYEQNWFGNVCPALWPALSPDSRYFWMTGYTTDLINYWSTAFAYCVDSETGARIDDYEVCAGYCFEGPMCFSSNIHDEDHHSLIDEMGSIYFSGANVLNIDSNAVAEISFYYFEEFPYPESIVEGIDTLPPPGGSDDNLFGDMCCASDISSDAEEVIEILSNPVRETLGVRLVGEYGDNFEILLYDIAGRQILSESGILRDDESLLNIGVQELPSGVYLLRIRTGDLEVVRTVSIIH